MKPRPDPKLAYRDALGRKLPERLSEYFDFERFPEKADLKVTRHELSVILVRHYQVMRDLKWYRRLWRYLKAKIGSGPVQVPEEPQ